MCCRIEEYKPYLELFEKVQLDSIHFDIMDGTYVKNGYFSLKSTKIG